MGIFLMVIGVLFAVITFGFGIICSWPLLIIGFIMIILGLISPSSSVYQQSSAFSGKQNQTKRICSNCGKTMSLNAKYCPHCGNINKYS
jgi:hypothetical protein